MRLPVASHKSSRLPPPHLPTPPPPKSTAPKHCVVGGDEAQIKRPQSWRKETCTDEEDDDPTPTTLPPGCVEPACDARAGTRASAGSCSTTAALCLLFLGALSVLVSSRKKLLLHPSLPPPSSCCSSLNCTATTDIGANLLSSCYPPPTNQPHHCLHKHVGVP